MITSYRKFFFLIVSLCIIFSRPLTEYQEKLYEQKRTKEMEEMPLWDRTKNTLDYAQYAYNLPVKEKVTSFLPEAVTLMTSLGLYFAEKKYGNTIHHKLTAIARREAHLAADPLLAKTKKWVLNKCDTHFLLIKKALIFGLPLLGYAGYKTLRHRSFTEKIFNQAEKQAQENMIQKTRDMYKTKKIQNIFETIFSNIGETNNKDRVKIIGHIQSILNTPDTGSKQKEQAIFNTLSLRDKVKAKKMLTSLSSEEIDILLHDFTQDNTSDSRFIRSKYPYLDKKSHDEEERKKVKGFLKPKTKTYTEEENKRLNEIDPKDNDHTSKTFFVKEDIESKRQKQQDDLWKEYYLTQAPPLTITDYNSKERPRDSKLSFFL